MVVTIFSTVTGSYYDLLVVRQIFYKSAFLRYYLIMTLNWFKVYVSKLHETFHYWKKNPSSRRSVWVAKQFLHWVVIAAQWALIQSSDKPKISSCTASITGYVVPALSCRVLWIWSWVIDFFKSNQKFSARCPVLYFLIISYSLCIQHQTQKTCGWLFFLIVP